MHSWQILILFAFIDGGLCHAALLVPCDMADLDCLGQSTKMFLEETSRGIKKYDIRPIDPWFTSSLDVMVDEDMGLLFHFTNLSVTGLKNQKIYDFQIDVAAKSVILKTKADLNIVGNIVVELSKQSKQYVGIYTALATCVGAAKYGYDLKVDANGVLHFEVGPETIQCEITSEPVVMLDPKLMASLQKDPDAQSYKPDYEANITSKRRETICKIVELCYVDVVHNIRAAAKVLPASAFFKDLTRQIAS